MSAFINTSQPLTFEEIYKNYSAPLYGMILKFAKSTYEAEDILIESFKFFIQQNIIPKDKAGIFLNLLKIAIPIASEKTNFSKQYIGKMIFKELPGKKC